MEESLSEYSVFFVSHKVLAAKSLLAASSLPERVFG